MVTLNSAGRVDSKSVCRLIGLISCLFVLSISVLSQSDSRKPVPGKAENEKSNPAGANSAEAQRRVFAISLVISLANDARSYPDLALRARVLARAADVLWDADNVTARSLFVRAWEAAEAGDADDASVDPKDKQTAMMMALRKVGGHDLRADVLSLASRRDKALAELFLAKLNKENESNAADSKTGKTSSGSEAITRRLMVARKLLADGQVDLARQLAAPALGEVNQQSIGFLSELRAKDAGTADQIFASLLARTELDPAADANTVSGLSSYAFTPGFYLTISADGQTTWSQTDSPIAPPNLPASLRDRFFQAAASVLLRPVPPPDQDFSSCGPRGRLRIITRLLPLFDQYAPNSATALRAQLSGSLARNINGEEALLTEGIKPPASTGDTLERMQAELDHAKSTGERDQIYAAAAVVLAAQGDIRARDLADKIENTDRRDHLRQYVDFSFAQLAIRKKQTEEAARLARTGQLAHLQRAWTYTQAARLLPDSQRERALSFLQEATDEARRIESDDPGRAQALIAVATQLFTVERARAWELMSEVVKAANTTEKFTGDERDISLQMLSTRAGVRVSRIAAADVSLARILRSLAQDDLEASVALAKAFKYDATRANSTLAIARAILENPPPNTAKN